MYFWPFFLVIDFSYDRFFFGLLPFWKVTVLINDECFVYLCYDRLSLLSFWVLTVYSFDFYKFWLL